MKKGVDSRWEVFKKLLQNYRTILALLVLGISLICHYFFIGSSFTSKGDINLFSLNGINLIILIVSYLYLSVVLLLVFTSFLTLLLKLVSKEIKDIEHFLLENLSSICFILVISVIFFKVQNQDKISIELLLTTVGAIIVFWYGYKTYERDKEIQMIERYSEKYNSIKTKLINTIDIKEKDYAELLTLWYEEYFLFEKGYISSELWDEWKFWIQEDIISCLYEAQTSFDKSVQEYQKKEFPSEDWFIYCLDTSTFLDSVFMTYAFKEKDKILIKDEFGKFLINLMKNLFEEKKKLNYAYHNKDWIIGMESLFNQINN